MKIKERDLDIYYQSINGCLTSELASAYNLSISRINQIIKNIERIKCIEKEVSIGNLKISLGLYNKISRIDVRLRDINFLIDQAKRNYPDCKRLSSSAKMELNHALILAGYNVAEYIEDIELKIYEVIYNKDERIIKFTIKDSRGICLLEINNKNLPAEIYLDRSSKFNKELIYKELLYQLYYNTK